MKLDLTQEQKALVEALGEFSRSEIRPIARECEEAGKVNDVLVKQLFEMGISTAIPEEFGGQGTFDAVTSVMVAEELAWGDPGIAFSVLGSGLAATLIDQIGTDEQRAALLPQFLEGSLGSVALAERDAGADIFRLESTAGAGGELAGTKYAVLNAEDAGVRLAVTGPVGAPQVWLVPPDATYELRPEDKLGLRSARTYKVTLDGAKAALVGSGDADKVRMALLRAKLLNAGIALGLARAALEYASDYAKERTAFGRPIGAFQGISFKIADRATDIDGARLIVWKAAWLVDQGADNAAEETLAACGHAVATAAAAADDGVQILGGHGYMKDHPVEIWYRDAMTLAALDSPSMVTDLFAAKQFEASA